MIHNNVFHDLRVTVPVDAPELQNTPLLARDKHFPVRRCLLDLLSDDHVSIFRACELRSRFYDAPDIMTLIE